MRTSRCWRRACGRTTCWRSPTPSRAPMPDLFSLEMWGGATFDTSMRFLQEDPWDRLDAAARAHPQHPVPDAAARQQRRRLHELSRQRRPRVHQAQRRATASTSSASSTRSTATENMKVAMEAVRDGHDAHLRGRDLLHRRHPRPEAHEVQPEVLREAGQGAGEDGHAHPGHQGHGRACASRTRRTRW